MRITINHETTYRYSQAMVGGVQYLRLTPSPSAAQDVVAWQVRAPGRLTAWRDEHGNACHSVTMLGKRNEVSVIARGEVETRDTQGILPLESASLPEGAYLRQSQRTAPDVGIIEFAERFRSVTKSDRLAGLHELMLSIQNTVAYDEAETASETTAQQAFERKRGVCQDHAHLFLSCARHLRVPARYVSGYLAPRGEGAGHHVASHAWAEAQVPDLGWVSFDPANGISADEHYVRLAVGFDYDKAAPISGVRQGGAGEDLAVQIRIQGQG